MKRMKAIASLALAATMVFGLAACGGAGKDDASSSSSSETAEVSSEGQVLNIYCWNEEFKSRITDHYADYSETSSDLEENDNGDIQGTVEGKIGDVKVVWHITPSKDNAYQNALDEALLGQADAAADDKVDLFLVEADYALKYVDTDATMSVSDLGITDADIADQYQYTKDVMTDSNGVLKGLSWQGCPGGLIYNRDIALEVLGTEDPEEVQEYVKDWDTYLETSKKMKEAGYYMTATANDPYRVFSNNVSKPWVDADKKIQIDDNLKKWVDMSKEQIDNGETTSEDLWGDQWKTGFYPEGKVFAYFGPAWLFNFSMGADEEGSVANSGRWGLAVGPQSFFWGGTWICGATGTDNADLVADIMKTMTTDETVLTEIVNDDDDFVNNSKVMEQFANDESYKSAILGGQNPNKVFCEGIKTVDLSNISSYDQGCNEKFQQAMKNYFDGNATYDEALEKFYTDVETTYPALSH